ncbi:MAG: NAD(+)/NADH kinase [Muribaculaceae bacterium]|nr:NAD(+)/NADH kinase [Muribaculaceae bacterium]
MLISLYGNTSQTHAIAPLRDFIASLRHSGIDIEAERNFASWLCRNRLTDKPLPPADRPCADSRLLLSIGGDGTFLQAARWLGDAAIPMAGINTGHLGYLAPWSFADARLLVDTLRSRQMQTERRSMLAVSFPADSCAGIGAAPGHALNEVALLKENSSSMISVRTMLDGQYLTDYLADGLVIATPTGSTAYSLSAGGPIIQPTAPALVLTPIAPHTLTMRPLIVEDTAAIRVIPTTRTGRYMLSLDGRVISLPSGTPVDIRRSTRTIEILRHPSDNFAATLRTKLLWGTNTTMSGNSV